MATQRVLLASVRARLHRRAGWTVFRAREDKTQSRRSATPVRIKKANEQCDRAPGLVRHCCYNAEASPSCNRHSTPSKSRRVRCQLADHINKQVPCSWMKTLSSASILCSAFWGCVPSHQDPSDAKLNRREVAADDSPPFHSTMKKPASDAAWRTRFRWHGSHQPAFVTVVPAPGAYADEKTANHSRIAGSIRKGEPSRCMPRKPLTEVLRAAAAPGAHRKRAKGEKPSCGVGVAGDVR